MKVPTMSNVGASFIPPPEETYAIANEDESVNVFGINWMAQVFKANTGFTVTGLKLPLFRTLVPGEITVSVQALSGGDPDGTDLSVAKFDGLLLPFVGTPTPLFPITMPTTVLTTGVSYAIVVRALAGTAGNTINWASDGSSPTYADGQRESSANSGNTWTAIPADDMCFEIYGF